MYSDTSSEPSPRGRGSPDGRAASKRSSKARHDAESSANSSQMQGGKPAMHGCFKRRQFSNKLAVRPLICKEQRSSSSGSIATDLPSPYGCPSARVPPPALLPPHHYALDAATAAALPAPLGPPRMRGAAAAYGGDADVAMSLGGGPPWQQRGPLPGPAPMPGPAQMAGPAAMAAAAGTAAAMLFGGPIMQPAFDQQPQLPPLYGSGDAAAAAALAGLPGALPPLGGAGGAGASASAPAPYGSDAPAAGGLQPSPIQAARELLASAAADVSPTLAVGLRARLLHHITASARSTVAAGMHFDMAAAVQEVLPTLQAALDAARRETRAYAAGAAAAAALLAEQHRRDVGASAAASAARMFATATLAGEAGGGGGGDHMPYMAHSWHQPYDGP